MAVLHQNPALHRWHWVRRGLKIRLRERVILAG
jgi:hypothetical protein